MPSPAIIEIPQVNSFRFVPLGLSLPSKYHLPQFRNDWHYNRLREWDRQVDYYQKIQTGDNWAFQFSAFECASRILRLIDAGGREWAAWTPIASTTMPGNTVVRGGMSYDLDTFHFIGSFSTVAGLPEGRYWLKLDLEFDTASPVSYISEPLEIKADHPDTVLVEYYNTRNAHDIVFDYDTIMARFSLRVEGHVHEATPQSEDVFYRDQKYNQTQLYSTAWESWRFSCGYQPGLAEWMVVKLNRIFSCDVIRIEGSRYMKLEGAKWEMQRFKTTPLVGCSIQVIPADNADASVWFFSDEMEFYVRPASGYPYAIYTAGLSTGAMTTPVLQAVVIDNLTEEQALLTALNSTYKYASGLTGDFAFNTVTGVYTYTNGDNEYYTGGDSVTMPKVFTLTKNITDPTRPFSMQINGQRTVIEWESAFAEIQGDVAPTSQTITYTFTGTSGTDASIRVFHDDLLDGFVCTHSRIKSLSGEGSELFTLFRLSNGLLSAFNGGVLASAAPVLETLSIGSNTALASISNMGQPWEALGSINFGGGILPSSEVDEAFNDYVLNAVTIPLNGTFLINNQTPAAPPTAASLASRNTLTSNGWTVTTD